MNKIQVIRDWLGYGSVNLFGLPFAGKDTQAKLLANVFHGTVISGGDILRQSSENQEIQQIMAKGGIIPSDLFEQIVVPYLSRPEFRGRPLILSEVGRLEGEHLAVINATTDSGHPQKAVILLNLPDETIWSRFESSQRDRDRGQRADDRKEVLQARLDNYHQKVMPVINYYRKIGLLLEINGTLPREQVHEQIIHSLYNKASA